MISSRIYFAFAAAMIVGAIGTARASCPATHLEPSTNYGRAFGTPEKVTTDIDPGPGADDEDIAFQYFEYQSRESREPGFSPVFAVHVFHDAQAAKARVVLGRLKEGKPVLVQAPLNKKTVELIKAIAAPIVRATRYRETPCPAMYLDGYVIQAGVDWRAGDTDANFIGGEAYAPQPGSPAHKLQVLGRALRAIASNKMAEADLDSFLREKGIAKSDMPQ